MAHRLVKVWKDHTYERGQNDGRTVEAFPWLSPQRGGYDIYPRDSNKLENASVARSLDELWAALEAGQRVRCFVPENGDTPILTGPFKAIIEQLGD